MLKNLLNFYAKLKEPIFFVIDFEMKNYYVSPISSMDKDIYFSFEKRNNFANKKIPYSKKPVSFQRYKRAFDFVIEEIKKGNTYLANLTFPSVIDIDYSLKEIYDYSDAKYKLYFKDEFVCFSPESFVEIKDNQIFTYPMKGTIDANIKNAKEIILNDSKELAEHTMVVDLLRNDLGMVADHIKVEKFRYIQTIKAGDKKLLQVSSKISGKLQKNWNEKLGDILLLLLPAGSISGTPKKSTISILKKAEKYDRGYFSGIFGVYENQTLKSAVIIRYIEKNNNKLIYKSGGGITIDSDVYKEYQELKDKIYVPFLWDNQSKSKQSF